MLDRGTELDAFKRTISLVEFAEAQGYVVDGKASSRSSVVLKDSGGDKVVVARAPDQHWIYFSVRDERDNGTIIDFVQRRSGGSLGEVRKQLRTWLGAPSSPARSPVTWRSLKPATKDILRVRARLEGMHPVDSHAYLEGERAIPRAILSAPRFAGCIRVDERDNAIFPHQDLDGYSGWEAKNKGFTGFAPGGSKVLWRSNAYEGDNCLVVAESAIDALSSAAVRPSPCTRYASIAGAMNPNQPESLRQAAKELPPGSRVLIATDNDEGGDKLLELIREALVPLGILTFEDRPQTRGSDWNDVLREQACLASSSRTDSR